MYRLHAETALQAKLPSNLIWFHDKVCNRYANAPGIWSDDKQTMVNAWKPVVQVLFIPAHAYVLALETIIMTRSPCLVLYKQKACEAKSKGGWEFSRAAWRALVHSNALWTANMKMHVQHVSEDQLYAMYATLCAGSTWQGCYLPLPALALWPCFYSRFAKAITSIRSVVNLP